MGRGGKGKNIGKCLGKKKTHTQERKSFLKMEDDGNLPLKSAD
jgi:hypothetical protein